MNWKMIIKIEKSPLYENCFSIRDKYIYEARKAGEPIIIETPEGQRSEPISPNWILKNIKPYPQKGFYEKPMMFYRTSYIIKTKEQKKEEERKLLMEAMI